MTVISNNAIARAIYLASKDKNSSEQSAIFKRVVTLLFRRRLLSKTPEILSQLKRIINQEEGRIIVKISSVEKINHKTKIHLGEILKKRYKAKEVVLEESEDKNLLGGLKIEVNNEVIDLSVKNKIKKLQEHLIKSV